MPDNQHTLARPGQERYVAESDEQGLGAVDAVSDESAPASMWGEAWKQLRRRPIFWVSAVLIVGALLLAIVLGLFTSVDPTYCQLAARLPVLPVQRRGVRPRHRPAHRRAQRDRRRRRRPDRLGVHARGGGAARLRRHDRAGGRRPARVALLRLSCKTISIFIFLF